MDIKELNCILENLHNRGISGEDVLKRYYVDDEEGSSLNNKDITLDQDLNHWKRESAETFSAEGNQIQSRPHPASANASLTTDKRDQSSKHSLRLSAYPRSRSATSPSRCAEFFSLSCRSLTPL